jgi:hypothetical protein
MYNFRKIASPLDLQEIIKEFPNHRFKCIGVAALKLVITKTGLDDNR